MDVMDMQAYIGLLGKHKLAYDFVYDKKNSTFSAYPFKLSAEDCYDSYGTAIHRKHCFLKFKFNNNISSYHVNVLIDCLEQYNRDPESTYKATPIIMQILQKSQIDVLYYNPDNITDYVEDVNECELNNSVDDKRHLDAGDPMLVPVMLIMVGFVFAVVSLITNPTIGIPAMLFNLFVMRYLYTSMKSMNYAVPSLPKFKKRTNKISSTIKNDPDLIESKTVEDNSNELYPKPVSEINILRNTPNCENIIKLSKDYEKFSVNDKREFTTCVKELTKALDLSKNTFAYVDNNKQDELFNEILTNVNKAMDNIAHNLYERNNDELSMINSFIKDKYDYNYLEK